jgi:hypothetical protein
LLLHFVGQTEVAREIILPSLAIDEHVGRISERTLATSVSSAHHNTSAPGSHTTAHFTSACFARFGSIAQQALWRALRLRPQNAEPLPLFVRPADVKLPSAPRIRNRRCSVCAAKLASRWIAGAPRSGYILRHAFTAARARRALARGLRGFPAGIGAIADLCLPRSVFSSTFAGLVKSIFPKAGLFGVTHQHRSCPSYHAPGHDCREPSARARNCGSCWSMPYWKINDAGLRSTDALACGGRRVTENVTSSRRVMNHPRICSPRGGRFAASASGVHAAEHKHPNSSPARRGRG